MLRPGEIVAIVLGTTACVVVIAATAHFHVNEVRFLLTFNGERERISLNAAGFHNGDIVLVRGNTTVSRVIRFMLQSPVSHVYIVSAPPGQPPKLHDVVPRGVRAIPLVSHLQAKIDRGDTVTVRRLTPGISPFSVQCSAYSFGIMQAVLSLYTPALVDFPIISKTTSRKFCSQLVTDVLVNAGALDFTHHPFRADVVLPVDFCELSIRELPWVYPYKLSPEVQLL